MDELLMAGLVGLATGAVGGVGTALVTPWAQWGVEKRREERAHNRALVASWRTGLSEWEVWRAGNRERDDKGKRLHLVAQPWFGSLHPYLSEGAARSLTARDTISINTTTDRNALAATIQREIDRIEHDFGLR